ncbi:MAG TPA: sugar ABC transporter permease, partial [Microlunatus sp.]|nr:sugar ABC transporter permease [Microlunatus sp.]
MSTADVTTQAPTQPSAAPVRRPRRSQALPAWLFIAPFGIFFLLFLIWPVIYMFISSLFDTTLVRPGLGDFVGFGNYAEMLTREDFWEAMWHTIQFTLYTVPPLVILAFVFAVLANRVLHGQWL